MNSRFRNRIEHEKNELSLYPSILDERSGSGCKGLIAIFAYANDGKPAHHDIVSDAKAFTAAAAIALPPRRPSRVIKGTSWLFETKAAFDSAAPTNPTGKPIMIAGFGPPACKISSKRKRAVGALPMATTAFSKFGNQASTAVAERVVPLAIAVPSKVQMM